MLERVQLKQAFEAHPQRLRRFRLRHSRRDRHNLEAMGDQEERGGHGDPKRR